MLQLPRKFVQTCADPLHMISCRKQDMMDILKDYGKTQVNPKEVARVFGK